MKGDISALLPAGTLLFSAYGDEYLRLNQHRFKTGLLIHSNVVTSPWGPASLHELTLDHLKPLIDSPPEVIILGTGRITAFPNMEILDYMADHHDSRAAARTYNILIGEGRPASAAMLLPGAKK